MDYLIDIRIEGDTKRTYRITAKSEEEANERLKLRLPPQQRDTIIIDNISIDKTTIADENPYGVFNEE